MTSNSKLLYYYVFLSFCYLSFASLPSSPSFNTTLTHKCSRRQSIALLQFKQSLSSINDTSHQWTCRNWLDSEGYYPIMMSWNDTSSTPDCCDWDGVTCDRSTGDVIGLDLSCGMLKGTIHPNTSLLDLPRLQRLNLAINDFIGSQLPSEIGRFSDSLTHLNISGCGFSGQVPSNITLLHKLVSLDLSMNLYDFRLEPYVFINLLQNATILKQLSLENVNISSNLPTYFNISSSYLKLLNLRSTRLQGELPRNIFNLRSLEILDLSHNSFTGNIPSEISLFQKLVSLDLSWNGFSNLHIQPRVFESLLQNSTLLRDLSLTFVNIYSDLPAYLNTPFLKSLDLMGTGLQGKLPGNIFNLPYLEELSLSGNYNITGPLPKVNLSTNIPLKLLYLARTNLLGEIPNSIRYFKFLTNLDLSYCGLIGSLPKSLTNLRHLNLLLLSSNKLNGTLPSWLFSLPSLDFITLDDNMFSGTLPFNLFSLRSLRELNLGHNELVGQFHVTDVDTMKTFQKLTNLTTLDLSHNKFSGVWELDTLLSSLENLVILDLSYSGVSIVSNNANGYVNPRFQILNLASCNLKMFPESLRAMTSLQQLNLSNNDIHGNIPDWAGEMGRTWLMYLDLSNNSITGLPRFQWDGLYRLHLQFNIIEGPLHPSICNMSYLRFLDLSNNSFSGVIPRCVRNIISSLITIDLGNNHLQGIIPNIYEKCGGLEGLILNGNELEGEVPGSLSKCQSLKVLDLGNNHLNGTFPTWLGDLSQLQVVVLKSNNFHGPIDTSSTVEFPFMSLQVLDLSHNGFFGRLPEKYFRSFNAMKNAIERGTKLEYLFLGGKYYSIVLATKGEERTFTKVFVDYTIVDLSYNKFEKEIPDIIGNLISLIVLDLSHNSLTGRIPHALRKLSEIESLDLSCNQLTGAIPHSLIDLTFLGFLNLSQNNLIGRIPAGKQFNTFEKNSFEGNPKLCGLPLPIKCEHPHIPQLEVDEDDVGGFTWQVVMWGYGCGTLLGLVLGYLMLSTGRPKWFNAIADAAEHMISTRRR